MRTRRFNRNGTAVARVAIAALALAGVASPGLVGRGAAQEPTGRQQGQEQRHAAECRLAHRILVSGRPAARRDWALERIGGCPELGGEAVAAELRRLRAAVSRTEELESVVRVADRFVDRKIAEEALDIAADPGSGWVARVQAIRVLSYQMSPGTHAPFESFIRPGGSIFTRASEPALVGEPLPDDLFGRIRQVLTGVEADPAAREAVRTAAANVASQARLEELCPDGTPPDTCDRRLRQAAGSS